MFLKFVDENFVVCFLVVKELLSLKVCTHSPHTKNRCLVECALQTANFYVDQPVHLR